MKNIIMLENGAPIIITEDDWKLVSNEDELISGIPTGKYILPISLWSNFHAQEFLSEKAVSQHGIFVAPDDDVEALQPLLKNIPLIAIQFPTFRDGRGYSQAYILRTRLGWTGELRAIGDVLRDQLSHMRQCGFNSFAICDDKSVDDAVKGLAGISVAYSRSVIEPMPLFRRR